MSPPAIGEPRLPPTSKLLFGRLIPNRLAELDMQPQSQDQRPERSTIAGKHNLQLAKPMIPTEYRLFTAIPFTSLFIALIILLAVLFEKGRLHGKWGLMFKRLFQVMHQ
jgi:hypothetical protein